MGTSGMHNIADRIATTRKDLSERGAALLGDLQERGTEWITDLQNRGEKLVGAGQRALDGVETTVLTRAHGFLGWAYGATGEKSDALRRGRDFFASRLDDADDLDEDETFDTSSEPFAGYDELNVKKIVEHIEGLEAVELRRVKAYEEANKGRKTVIAAAERLLEG